MDDKLVSMNLVQGRGALKGALTAHDERFNLPNTLPIILSKHKHVTAKYDWKSDKGRDHPIYFNKGYDDHWNLKTDKLDRIYDFDLEKT